MSDSKDDHWNELAKQLGLDSGTPGPKSREIKEERKPAQPVKVPHFEEEEAHSDSFLQSPLDHVAPLDTSAREVSIHQPERDDISSAGPADPLAGLAELEEAPVAEDKPKRRGRGRGRGRKKDDVAIGGSGEKLEEPRSRRGRGRKKPVEDEEEREEVVAVEEEDNEEVEDVSEWNIPAWNDLIASLYRPER